MCSSKKGISAHQLHRTLDIRYESAWFMCHRIRECMRQGGLAPLGGSGKVVEADETYFGRPAEPHVSKQRGDRPYQERPYGINVHRCASRARRQSPHIPCARCRSGYSAGDFVQNISRESRLHTDESRLYFRSAQHFSSHETVKHSASEYARGDVTTNTIEGYFSIFKRGMRGVYQHCAEKHLHRYLAEYDFRYNHRVKLGYNDGERAALAVKSAAGKRLTYRQPH